MANALPRIGGRDRCPGIPGGRNCRGDRYRRTGSPVAQKPLAAISRDLPLEGALFSDVVCGEVSRLPRPFPVLTVDAVPVDELDEDGSNLVRAMRAARSFPPGNSALDEARYHDAAGHAGRVRDSHREMPRGWPALLECPGACGSSANHWAMTPAGCRCDGLGCGKSFRVAAFSKSPYAERYSL